MNHEEDIYEDHPNDNANGFGYSSEEGPFEDEDDYEDEDELDEEEEFED